MQRIKDLIKGKSVAIVGNAESIYNTYNKIDSHDVVIRSNYGYPRAGTYRHTGRRTDIVLFCYKFSTNTDMNIYKKFNPQYVVSLDHLADNKGIDNYVIYPDEYINDIRNKVFKSAKDPHASTGLNSLDMCMRLGGYKDITLYGFDFFQTKDWSTGGNGKRKSVVHDFNIEQLYIMDIIRYNENINIKGVDSMGVPKKKANKAVLSAVKEKVIKEAVVKKTTTLTKCECGHAQEVNPNVRTSCWNCGRRIA